MMQSRCSKTNFIKSKSKNKKEFNTKDQKRFIRDITVKKVLLGEEKFWS